MAPPEDHEGWRPPFIPHDVAPRLVNADEVLERLRAAYPPELRAAGIGGEVVLWLYVTERGEPREGRVARSAGEGTLDSLARVVSREMRFRPALAHSRPVAVWIAQPIRFSVAVGAEKEPAP